MSSRKTVLEIINDYSLELYHLLKTKKIKPNYLYQAVLAKDKEAILNKILPISNKKRQILLDLYPKENCLDEILLLTDNRYHYIKEIRNIVNLEDFIEFVITDKIYKNKVNIYYTNLIVDILVENFYDYKSLQLFSKMKTKIIEMDSNANKKIMGNIDKFYIRRITI